MCFSAVFCSLADVEPIFTPFLAVAYRKLLQSLYVRQSLIGVLRISLSLEEMEAN